MRRLLPPFLAALVLRTAAVALTADLACHADECWYRELVLAFLAGDGILPNRGHLWPPGYVMFLSAHAATGMEPFLAAKLSQALVGAATVFPVAFLAEVAFGARVALAAAWIVALSPTLVAFAHYLWPETLFLFVFVGAVALLVEIERRLAAGEPCPAVLAIGTGIVAGLACLVKSLPFYLVPILVARIVVVCRPRTRSALAAVLVLVALGVTLLPWIASASARWQRFVPLEATLGVNLWRGNNESAPFDADWGIERQAAEGDSTCDAPNPIDRDRCHARLAANRVIAHPGEFAARVPTKMADLWTPTSFLVRHVRAGFYGALPPPLAEAIVALDVAWWIGVALAATIGFTLPLPAEQARARSFRTVVWILLAYVVGVHALTFGMSRFRLPLYPFLAVLAAFALSERRRMREIVAEPRRLLAVGIAWTLLFAMWIVRWGSVRAAE